MSENGAIPAAVGLEEPVLFSSGAGNPFRGSVMADAWKGGPGADVSQIHQDLFQICRNAVEQARIGSSSAGVILYGAAGSGKTHLIGRLRRSLTDHHEAPSLDRLTQAFAYVRLNANPAFLYRHVRQRVAEDLLRGPARGLSQLERMVITRLMDASAGDGDLCHWWEYCCEERRDELPAMVEEFGSQENLSHDFIRVLTHLVLRQHRLDVRSWLQGTPLREEAAARLGLTVQENDNPEAEAAAALRDFMRLAGEKMPLVICFDQIEALQTRLDDIEAFHKYGQLITELHDSDTNLVLISCVQSSMLDTIARAVPEYALHRMRSYAASNLQPLDPQLALALLQFRLIAGDPSRAGLPSEQILHPLTLADVRRFVGPNGCTPRHLLDQAATRWDELHQFAVPITPIRPLEERMEEEWNRRFEQIQAENRPEQSADILRDGVPRLMEVLNQGWRTEAASKFRDLDYLFIAPQREACIGMSVCPETANALAGKTRRLADLCEADTRPFQKLVLLCDERMPISRTAKKTEEYLKRIEQHDGQWMAIAPEVVAALDAMRKLLADAAAGDLDLAGEQIPAHTVLNWLRTHLPMPLREFADQLTVPANDMAAGPQCDQLLEFLGERCIVAVEEIAEALQTGSDQILELAERRPDLFGLIRGERLVLFSTRSGSRSLRESASA